ncbi:MAG: sigma-54-dependent Fis family transcriptional regulator [Chlamydiales bacterium]|nr:sigma-54-dependent Fis family transcriptional regulator [Chlamydiia bacterium]MCP5506977.1 sigma-54-dependent Fis family transcriptional regulator [Chlamydiales bacterium]
MAIEKILVIDDEAILRDFLAETLRRKGLEVSTHATGSEALKDFKKNAYDMVITDMRLPDITGIDILKQVKEVSPHCIVVVITGYGTIENAVEAMRSGAYNYIMKPFNPEALETVIEKANEHLSLLQENQYLRKEAGCQGGSEKTSVIGNSAAMKKVLQDVEQVAKSNANVMISGESGTGKEVIATALHNLSLRTNKSFIRVNCAAVPDTLIESEFFGHEKGAFTGAHSKRPGRFELANQGTLLLDEITEVPILLQAKLLRAIQEQEFERVGGTKPVKVDVRIISTTNRNIEEAIKNQILREDLYYRLNVIPIHLPPLRDRKDDIIPLAEHFIAKFCIENHKERMTLGDDAKEKLLHYSWPGNVRELGNIIERAVVMNPGKTITTDHLYIGENLSSEDGGSSLVVPVGTSLRELEKKMIIETLEAQHQNKTKTAELLDISVRTLRNKLNEYKNEV